MLIKEATDSVLKERLVNIKRFIGNTPLFPISRVFENSNVKIYAKQEWMQLGGSIKARAAYHIIEQAILDGELYHSKHLLDASSGNTGIAYAAIGSALGIPVTICLPENASEERKTTLKAFRVNIIYTSRFGGTDEAQEKARELYELNPDKYFYADQYNNENNWKAHYHGTAEEIYNQTEGKITHFVAGLGTSGTFMGTGRKLKEKNPDIKLISLQPDAILHGLEGWKNMESATVPSIYDASLADKQLVLDTYEAFEWVKKIASAEGVLVSPSAAANIAGAIKVAENLEKGVVVTVMPDNGDKYSEILKLLF